MEAIDIDELIKDYKPDHTIQAVFIYVNFPIGKLENKKALDAVFSLHDLLADVIEKTGVGRFDGNEFCDSPDEESVTFFMYGPDADAMYEVIEPIISSLPSFPGSYITKRYGDIGSKEEKVFLP